MNTIIKFLAGTSLSCMISSMAVSCSNEENRTDVITDINDFVEGENHNILIAYFSEPLPENGADAVTSASRVTVGGDVYGSVQYMATVIADATGGDLFELEPVEPYTDDDLNWTDDNSRVSQEHEDESLRDVELVSSTPENWDSYDTVFIGYPIWWGIAAWPVDRFVESNDFTGKTVIPFATSASSGMGESGQLLEEMAGTGEWQEGQRFRSGADEADVQEWVNGLGL